jgi:hypothetical protein
MQQAALKCHFFFLFLSSKCAIQLFCERQVGVTPGGVEIPRCVVDGDMARSAAMLPEASRPSLPSGPDPKWRYMWRIGPRPTQTKFQVTCFYHFACMGRRRLLVNCVFTFYLKFAR